MEGFEHYSIYKEICFHFNIRYFFYKKNYHTTKAETYMSDKYYNLFETYYSKMDKNYFTKLIISNILRTGGYVDAGSLKNNLSQKTEERWEETIENIDQIFANEVINLMDFFALDDPRILFKTIIDKSEEVKQSEVVDVTNIDQVINDKIKMNEIDDNEFIQYLSKYDMNFLVVLDEIMKQKCDFSFLEYYNKKNKGMDEHPFIKAFKYKMLLPIESFLEKPKIKMFIDCL